MGVGKQVEDDNLISYILGRLNLAYTAFITSYNFSTHDISMTFHDFQVEILNFETLLSNQYQSVGDFRNYALYSHKRKSSNYNSKKPFGYYKRNYKPSKKRDSNNIKDHFQANSNKAPCQICGKTDHQALDCH